MSKYKLRPSGSSRWLECPASLVLEEIVGEVKRDDLFPAFIGTAAHEILERCIKGQTRACQYLGTTVEVFDEEQQNFPYTALIDEKIVNAVNFFLDEVGEPDSVTKGEVFSELEMEHSEIEGLRGTADFFRYDEETGHGILADLKNGVSTVQVQNRKGELNTQLLCYASLLFDRFEGLKTITIAIIQPNAKTKLKTRTAGVDRKIVEEHLDKVREAAKLANEATEDTIESISKEGSHCWWCRAKGICTIRGRAEINKDFGGGE